MKREQIKSPLLEDSEQENKTISIQQEEIKHNFIIVYETIYKNPKLTINEMGLLIKLISLAPTFKVNSKSLIKMLKIHFRLINNKADHMINKHTIINRGCIGFAP